MFVIRRTGPQLGLQQPVPGMKPSQQGQVLVAEVLVVEPGSFSLEETRAHDQRHLGCFHPHQALSALEEKRIS